MNTTTKSQGKAFAGIIVTLALFMIVFSMKNSYAQDIHKTGKNNRVYLGYSVDLFPAVISAIQGKAGYSFQTWLGIDHVKLRVIGASTHAPGFLLSDDFENHKLTVGALISDYGFGDNMTGFWIGSGVEMWMNEIGHKDTSEKARWTNGVLTVGGGHIWKLAGNLYINPWAGAHFIMNNHSVHLAGKSYTPTGISASVSVKIGYYFDI